MEEVTDNIFLLFTYLSLREFKLRAYKEGLLSSQGAFYPISWHSFLSQVHSGMSAFLTRDKDLFMSLSVTLQLKFMATKTLPLDQLSTKNTLSSCTLIIGNYMFQFNLLRQNLFFQQLLRWIKKWWLFCSQSTYNVGLCLRLIFQLHGICPMFFPFT